MDDFADGFDTWHDRAVDRPHLALPPINLRPIQTKSTDSNLHVIRARLGRRDIAQLQNVQAAGTLQYTGLHGAAHARGWVVAKR